MSPAVHPHASAVTDSARVIVGELSVGAVGIMAGATVSDLVALTTAAAAGFFMVCRGLVLVIREWRRGKRK
jgi:hypothetical protein